MIDEEFYNHIQFLIRLRNSIEETSRNRTLTIADRKIIDGKGPRTVLTPFQMYKINQILELLGEESSNNVQQAKTLDYSGDIKRIINILQKKYEQDKEDDMKKIKMIYDHKERILSILFQLEAEIQYGFDIGDICDNKNGREPGD